MKHESIFFAPEGAKGLNETSASHLAALASQQKEQYVAVIEALNFVDEERALIGSNAYMRTSSGCSPEKFKKISAILDKIAELNAFISWFAEARKYLENYKDQMNDVSIEDWAKTFGVELPEKPDRPSYKSELRRQDIIDEMNIKDRQAYLALEAKASVLGKFIHNDGAFESARDKAHKKLATPYSTRGDGRDTLVYKYTLSVPVQDIDKKYNQLQHEYRAVEQQLNHMKADILKKLNARNIEIQNENRQVEAEYRQKSDEYHSKYNEIISEFNAWKIQINEEMSKIKLAIPDALADMVTYLNNIDK